MRILKWIIKIIVFVALVALAAIGLRYIIRGGWTELKDKYTELGSFWEFIKWFVLNK